MKKPYEIIEELRNYDSEREWFEFKENWFKADELGDIKQIRILESAEIVKVNL